MSRIAVDDLSVGMTLEKEAKDRSGRVLLGAGANISAKSIQIFKSWGVSVVDVVSEDSSPKKHSSRRVISETELADNKTMLESLFKYHDLDDPVSAELLAECLAARLRTLERS